MAISDRMTFVRDIIPICNGSGESGYVVDKTNKRSGINLCLRDDVDQDLGSDDSTYIKNANDQEGVYAFRLNHNTIVPDAIKIKIRGEASAGGSNELYFVLNVNGTEIGTIGPFGTTASNITETFTLSDSQIQSILRARVDAVYDHCRLRFYDGVGSGSEASIDNARLYAVEFYYENSDDNRYQNYTTTNPNPDIRYFYPSGVGARKQVLVDESGNPANYSTSINKINQPPSGVDTDNTYLEVRTSAPTLGNTGNDRTSFLPSGYLSMSFGVMGGSGGYDPISKVNRATFSLRMAFPPSGSHSNNTRDSFEIVGHSPHFDLENDIAGREVLSWGAGEVIQQQGFKTYQADLAFLNPDLYDDNPQSDMDSLQYNSVESFEDIEFRIWGVPSGTRISSAELRLETQTDKYLPLFIPGGVENCQSVLEPSGSSRLENRFRGNWEHSTRNEDYSTFFNEGYYTFDDSGYTFNSKSNSDTAVVRDIYNQGGAVETSPTKKYQYSNPPANFEDNWLNAIGVNEDHSGVEFLDCDTVSTSTKTFFAHVSVDREDILGDNPTLMSVGDYYSGGVSSDRNFTLSLNWNYLVLQYQDSYGNYTTHYLQIFYTEKDDIFICVSYDETYDNLRLYAYTGGSFYSSTINDDFGRETSPAFAIGDLSDSSRVFEGYVHEAGASTHPLTESEFKNIVNSRFNNAGQYIKDDLGLTFDNETTYWGLDFVQASGEIREEASIASINFPSSLYNISYPTYVDYGLIPVAPSSVSFEICAEHESNHPSGVELHPTFTVRNGEVSTVYQGYLHIPSGSSRQVHTVYNTKIDQYVPRGDDDRLVGNLKLTTEYNHYNDRYYDGDLKIYYAKVNVDAWCTPVKASGDNVPLYTSGGYPNESIDLYLHSDTHPGDIDLYVQGKALESKKTDLFILSNSLTKQKSLYIQGYTPSSGNFPLYIGSSVDASGSYEPTLFTKGIFSHNEELNLFVEGLNPPDASGDLDFFMWSTTNPAIRDIVPLYTNSQFDNDYSLNLYIKGDPGFNYTSSMNLFMEGWAHGTLSSGTADLFLSAVPLGDYEPTGLDQLLFPSDPSGVYGKSNSIGLYMLAPSGTTYNEDINLYIERDSEAIAHRFPMFISAPSGTNDNVNMYVDGVFKSNDQITVFMSGGHTPNNSLDLYSHGF